MRSALSLFVALVAASVLAQGKETYKVEARGERYSLALDVRQLGESEAECDVSIVDLSTNAVIWQPHLVGKARHLELATEKDGRRYEITVRIYANVVTADLIIDRQGVMIDSLFTGWRGPSHLLQMNVSGVYRSGGNVKEPRPVKRVEPVYPFEARANGVKGIVILRTLIDKTGTLREVLVLKELGHGLTEASVNAVERWRFKPATLNGEAVDAVSYVTMNFTLE